MARMLYRSAAAFPGHDPAFYDALVYAGTIGSPVFEELSEEAIDTLKNFSKKMTFITNN